MHSKNAARDRHNALRPTITGGLGYPPVDQDGIVTPRRTAFRRSRSMALIESSLGRSDPRSQRETRHRVSLRMPASLASSNRVSPASTLPRLTFRARLARAYSTAG